METLDKRDAFVELRAKGLSFAKISDSIGISKPTLIKWSKELEIDIQNMCAIEHEALREKYQLTKEKRLELFSESLEKVKKEMAMRDLSGIPTEKLFLLNIKLLEALKSEETRMTLSERGEYEINLSETRVWSV